MEAEGRYTLVGVVVLATLAALIAAGVWLSGGTDRDAYRNYTVYFKQQSMDGLALGSAVKLLGIKVGSVSAYHFVESGRGEGVRVTLKVGADVPIRTSAQAWVKRSLVTGLATIEVANQTPDAPRLDEVPDGERYPVIAEGSSDLDKVTTAVSRIAETGAETLERINALLSDENRQSISTTLANLDALSSHLADNKASLNAVVQSIQDASTEFRFAGASIAQAATRAEDSITRLSTSADQALQQTALTMLGLQNETAEISDQIQTLSQAGALELLQTSRDVRSGADALTTAGQQLSDPRGLIFTPTAAELGPGETLP